MENSFKIYFINLNDRSERWEKFVRHAKFYPSYILDCCERIDAFDSRTDTSFLNKLGLKIDPVSAPNTLYFSQAKGAIGCYASHYYCWSKIIEDKVESALILEDDINIHDTLELLSSNPDLDDDIELHHFGHRGFNGLEAYILNAKGANKLISLTHDCSPLEGHVKLPLKGNFGGQNPFEYQYFKDNSTYSFNKLNSIIAPVDKFVGYCSNKDLDPNVKLNLKFKPSIGLSSSAHNSSDIENENHGQLFNNMTEFEINELVQSDCYKWWSNSDSPVEPQKLPESPKLYDTSVSSKKLTVCVCTYDNYRILKSCLHFLSKQSVGKENYNVIVLDNTSSNKLPELDDKNFTSVIKKCDSEENFQYIYEETQGLSGARNRCTELADTEFIHFIDDDSLAYPNFIKNTLDCIDRYTDLHVIGGKTEPNWGSEGRPPWLSENLLGLLSILDLGDKEIFFNDLPPNKQWFVGANICFRKQSILDYGGFDNSLGRKGSNNSLLGGEENDLLEKIAKENLAIYSPNIVVDHLVSGKRLNQSWFLKRIAWQSVSEIMANDIWIEEQHGISEFIEGNLGYLTEDCSTAECFEGKLKLVQYLIFKILHGGDIK